MKLARHERNVFTTVARISRLQTNFFQMLKECCFSVKFILLPWEVAPAGNVTWRGYTLLRNQPLNCIAGRMLSACVALKTFSQTTLSLELNWQTCLASPRGISRLIRDVLYRGICERPTVQRMAMPNAYWGSACWRRVQTFSLHDANNLTMPVVNPAVAEPSGWGHSNVFVEWSSVGQPEYRAS